MPKHLQSKHMSSKVIDCRV